jgi:hypothetical protein
MKSLYTLIVFSLFCTACTSTQPACDACASADAGDGKPAVVPPDPGAGELVVVPVGEVDWKQLNPARGDASPQAGTLWGDRKGEVPTGFLAKFVDGFSSPPHIHNATYRAVVIRGEIHNDDPDAAKMWMPAGSFWTQPKGEVHITAAKGDVNIALVEIDMGPYLVMPPEEAFDSGERPVNVDVGNLVWADPPGFAASDDGPKVAYLWGKWSDGHDSGTFIKLPSGFTGTIASKGKTFRAVVIRGGLKHGGAADKGVLPPGSYFGSAGAYQHDVSASGDGPCILYIRTDARFDLLDDASD